jgi:branched-chain amino acid transport system substrate-binding protein
MIAVAASVVAGCSSSGSSSSTGQTGTTSTPASATAAGTGSAAATPTGSPIIVGNIGSYSGPEASSEAGAQNVIEAWAAYTNANGGIAGHPVKLIVMDDGSNPTTALSEVKQLVADKVVAIVSDISNVDSTWESYIDSAGIPVVGGITDANLPFTSDPNFYPQGTNLISGIMGGTDLTSKVGPKSAFLYCAESPNCAASIPLTEGIGKLYGVSLVLKQSVSASATNFIAPCQAIKSSGAQTYSLAEPGDVAVAIADGCARQGVTAKVVTGDGVITPALLGHPGMNGMIGTEPEVAFFDQSIPATKLYHQVLQQYAASIANTNQDNSHAISAWVSGLMFTKAVELSGATQSTPVTPASIKSGLYAFKNETLGGLAPPLNFVQGKPAVINCYFVVGMSGNQFTQPDGTTPQCVSAALALKTTQAMGFIK